MIRRIGNAYYVFDHTGKKKLHRRGKTLAEAQRMLAAIEAAQAQRKDDSHGNR